MTIKVRLFASLRKYLPPGEREINFSLKEGGTVEEAISKLGLPTNITLLILVNGKHSLPAQQLKEGDILSIFPPLAGGCSRA